MIDRLTLHWRPLAPELADAARYRRLGEQLADGALESAMAAAGLQAPAAGGPTETAAQAAGEPVICIRCVEAAPVRIRADAGDDEVLGVLAANLAVSIEAALAAGGEPDSHLVRFRSMAHAACELLLWRRRGGPDRTWAWRQLGLLTQRADAIEAGPVAAALGGSPGALPALLDSLAGGGALPDLVVLLGRGELDRLVRSAWAAAGGMLAPWEVLLGSAAAPSADELGRATTLLGRGPLGRLLLAGSALGHPVVASLAAAAVLGAEPAIGRHGDGAGGRLVTAAALVALGHSTATRTGAGEPPGAQIDATAPPTSPSELTSPESGTAAAPDGELARPAAAGDEVLPGVASSWAGLVFLLHLVEVSGLPDRVAGGPLASLGLSRVLCELGTALLARAGGGPDGADPEDAAIACFCGRRPNPGWRAELGLELTAEAAAIVEGETERLLAALRSTLEPSPLAGAEERELLLAVCRRRGRIVAAPGWVDVCLELDEVSTDLRRAGLDLDLGWLGWLGCVVRFVYG